LRAGFKGAVNSGDTQPRVVRCKLGECGFLGVYMRIGLSTEPVRDHTAVGTDDDDADRVRLL
jgi:hypothetical protein